MRVGDFLALCREAPLIVSVQASDGSPVQAPDVLASLAWASKKEGVRILRLQGGEAIRLVRQRSGLPTIGLVKRAYPGSEIYITATLAEVDEVIDAGAEIVAMDGTPRNRPGGVLLAELVAHAHRRGALVLADIDSESSADHSVASGADMLSTTLSGYTHESQATRGPDLELLRRLCSRFEVPILAEGRFEEPWQVRAARRIGAAAVIVGGAINDPEKNTRRFMPPPERGSDLIGAVDIGGTWIRFGVFSSEWKLLEVFREPNPVGMEDRVEWIRRHVRNSGVSRLGVGTGGIVDPATGEVWTAKEYLMPNHIGIVFNEETMGVATFAHGDGHATAWGHACLPEFAGRRVATLTLGTGVGCGFVREHQIWCGRRGEYPRINDLPAPGGSTYEDLLGGIHLGVTPSSDQQIQAKLALKGAMGAIRDLYFPDEIIVSGSVGMSEWLREDVLELGGHLSPFGVEAGIFGAAALALYPPNS